jgi:hypothetical protein
MQKVGNGKQKMNMTWEGKSYRSFVRSFVVVLVVVIVGNKMSMEIKK